MKAVFALLILFTGLFAGLHHFGTSPRHDAAGTNPLYLEHLARSAESAVNPPPGSDAERALVQKVTSAFHPFTYGNVTLKFPEAYAGTFYFRDAFHVFTDRDTMVAYMQRTARQSPGVTFEFEAPGRNGIDFYLPWVMVLPAREGGEPQRSVGVSRLRFNEDGQVIFHQDYWDSADVLVPRVPVANGIIELVRRRF
jgi:hypothetical protein